ncbi:MAG TPA: hypothetical protein VMS89_03125 [Methanoregulaceae archaeon]|nr:hypothetical protein [Methanoregulaceae archaeon]
MDDPKTEIIVKLKEIATKRCSERIEKARIERETRGVPVELVVQKCEITALLKQKYGL